MSQPGPLLFATIFANRRQGLIAKAITPTFLRMGAATTAKEKGISGVHIKHSAGGRVMPISVTRAYSTCKNN